MNVIPGIKIRQIGTQYMIVNAATAQDQPTAVHALNSTAVEIWQFAEAHPGFTPADVARFIEETYEVTYDTALADATALLSQWHEHGLLTE